MSALPRMCKQTEAQSMLISTRLLKAVSHATTKDQTHYALNSIQLEPDGSAVATDEYILLKGKALHPPPDADFPSSQSLPALREVDRPVGVPVDLARRLIGA